MCYLCITIDPYVAGPEHAVATRYVRCMQDRVVGYFNVITELGVKIKASVPFLG
jgi:hypothetical protein